MLTELLLLLFLSLVSCPWAFFWADCPCCGTCPCEPATNFQVDIAGVVNNSCVSCTNLDGTYYLTQGTTTCGGFTADCVWKYSNTSMGDPCVQFATCNGMCIELIQDEGTDSTALRIFSVPFVGGVGCSGYGKAEGRFTKDWLGGTKDCTVYSSLDVPFLTNATTACDFSAATCTVTQS